ncbi:serine/threonine-protein phosphatase [Leptospira semungkisensis]|uniref:Serine/threonine-protein phosphatase n=1 Tax=Leptospira semungkisensis TaxID=2484985 RepID=A0A4R9G4Y1_9LEPT|nr:SpoIIE family protein phosphatase [Leptospira semungkisensis]TGK06588.1 serine/threonine-protein phosphatase [Leptospira semungkisensis]
MDKRSLQKTYVLIKYLVCLILFFSFFSISSEEAKERTSFGRYEFTDPLIPIKLHKEWRFSSQDNPSNSQSELDDSTWFPLATNDEWNRHPEFEEHHGIGWYRSRIHISENALHPGLGLLMPVRAFGYELFLNGKEIYSSEFDPNTKSFSKNNAKPVLIPIPDEILKSGENFIAIRGYSEDNLSSFEGDILFGRTLDLSQEQNSRTIRIISIIAVQLFLFVYSLVLFANRRNEAYYLHYSLLNILLALWLLGFKGYISLITESKTYYIYCTFISAMLINLSLLRFVYTFFSQKRDKAHDGIVFFYTLIVSEILIEYWFTGSILYFMKYLYDPFIASVPLTLLFLIYKVTYFSIKKYAFAFSLLIALLAVFAFFVHGIFIFTDVLADDPMVNEGFFVMSLIFSFVLAKRYSNTFHTLESTQASLKSLNESLETKVIERTQTIAAQKEEIEQKTRILERDLAIAAKIQSSLLPSDLPKIPNIRLAYRYEPMLDVGGDFVDSVVDRTGRAIGIFICDVTGHGTGAAMVASMVKMALADWTDYLSDPGHMLTKMRAQLIGKLNGNFLTATIATFFPETGRLLIANAGHPETVILRRNFPKPELFRPSGMAITELMKTPYHTEITVMGPGDKLVLYTDGLPEARKPNGDFYGDEKFLELLSECAGLDPDPFCSTVIQQIRSFTQDKNNSHDDMAMIVLEYLGKAENITA